mmetsp:Transcript_25845/g.60857  ORF Transcript_25845/g.60857 Transcript_25845/m.60857 type:complete len:112 (-) Transcript_25845:239-574(-)
MALHDFCKRFMIGDFLGGDCDFLVSVVWGAAFVDSSRKDLITDLDLDRDRRLDLGEREKDRCDRELRTLDSLEQLMSSAEWTVPIPSLSCLLTNGNGNRIFILMPFDVTED